MQEWEILGEMGGSVIHMGGKLEAGRAAEGFIAFSSAQTDSQWEVNGV